MKVLIACGGTAGHIFPGLALAEELIKEDKHASIIIVRSAHPKDKEFFRQFSSLKGVQLETVGTSFLPYRLSFSYIPFTIKLIAALFKSFYIMLRYRPEVAVGFGGYVSFAPLIAAWIFGVPSLIHEQNLMPGRANRLLARVVDKVAVSFGQTSKFFPEQIRNKIVETGLPLRKHILAYSPEGKHRLSSTLGKLDKFTILVIGGSLGAHNVNQMVLEALSRLDKRERARMKVIHLTGKKDFGHVKARYQALGLSFRVFDFLEDMASAYGASDLLIGRSGAVTVFEAARFGLPCILIPHAYGTRHQKENAFYLKRMGAALVLDEETLSIQELEKTLRNLIADKRMRQDLSQRIKTLTNIEAGHNLKEEIQALHREHYV